MIRGKIKNDPTRTETEAENSNYWTDVVFRQRGDPAGSAAQGLAADSFDEDQTSNADDLCNVCHFGFRWSNLDPADDTQPHFLGKRCVTCHPHGEP